MPVYEFQCKQCGERFEIVANLADREEKAVCPACGGRDAAQVFGAFKVGISRTRLNPGTFERKKGSPATHKPPAGG